MKKLPYLRLFSLLISAAVKPIHFKLAGCVWGALMKSSAEVLWISGCHTLAASRSGP